MAQNHEQRLTKIVGERMLVVADYQRPYAWDRKQLEDLWEDLDLLGPRGTHYAGTLVLRSIAESGVPLEVQIDDGAVLQKCEIVDGQQRLTTCFILIDGIRRALERLDTQGVDNAGPMAQLLRRTFGTVVVDQVPHSRLRLADDLQRYWEETILGEEPYVGPPLLAGHRRLRDAAAFFTDKIAGLTRDVPSDIALARLRELYRRITAGLEFLVYEVGSLAEVGVIFETLNERGRPLTDLEKAKNYLLYLARSLPDSRQDALAAEINERWAEIFRNLARLGAGQEEHLLRAHWLATQDPDLRSWKRIESIKKKFDRSRYVTGDTRLVVSDGSSGDRADAGERLHDEVRTYVKSLRDCSYFLAEMFDPSAPFSEFGNDRDAVLECSGALFRSGVVAIYRPLLFAARLAHGRDGAFYRRLVRACERYSARVFVIEKRRSTAGEARLARLANDLVRSGDRERVLAEIDALNWSYAPDSRVSATLANLSQDWYSRRGHKYFLYEYELSNRRAAREVLPYSAFVSDSSRHRRTTEHILPQTLGEADCWRNRFSGPEHGALVHALGNLVLTYDNSAYSNKCFDQKRGHHLQEGESPQVCYAQGELAQERELARWTEWTPATVEQRQRALAVWALERWRIEHRPDEPVGEPEPEPDGSDEDEEILDHTLHYDELERPVAPD